MINDNESSARVVDIPDAMRALGTALSALQFIEQDYPSAPNGGAQNRARTALADIAAGGFTPAEVFSLLAKNPNPSDRQNTEALSEVRENLLTVGAPGSVGLGPVSNEPVPANVQRLLNEAAIHFESFPGGRDGDGMALLYRAIKELKDNAGDGLAVAKATMPPAIYPQPLLSDKSPSGASPGIAENAGCGAEPESAPNPNPSGHQSPEASGAPTGTARTAEASGLVGLGPVASAPVGRVPTLDGLAHYVPPSYERILWRGAYLDLAESAPKRREIDWYAKVPVENRFTIDMCSGKLIQDQDGPWVLRTMVDNALQFAREDAEPKARVTESAICKRCSIPQHCAMTGKCLLGPRCPSCGAENIDPHVPGCPAGSASEVNIP